MNPGGKRLLSQIDRGPEVEKLACEFIACAGRYLIEIRQDGKVHLMAIIDKAEGCTEVAHEAVENGPELPKAVDRLIRESVKYIPLRSFVPANSNNMELVP